MSKILQHVIYQLYEFQNFPLAFYNYVNNFRKCFVSADFIL